jgi:hypothetical protein
VFRLKLEAAGTVTTSDFMLVGSSKSESETASNLGFVSPQQGGQRVGVSIVKPELMMQRQRPSHAREVG